MNRPRSIPILAIACFLLALACACMACRSCHSQTVPPDAYAAAYAQWETGDRPLLVVFGAKWCGPCREVDAKLPELARDFVIVHLDVDRDRALIARYGLPKPEKIPCCLVYPPHHRHYAPHWHDQGHPHGPWLFLGLPGFRLILNR